MKNSTKLSLITILFSIVMLNSCKKDYPSIESVDDAAIQAYIKKNNLTMSKDSLGVYYQVVEAGTGDLFQNRDSVFFTYQEKSIDNGDIYYSTNVNGNDGTYFGYMTNTLNGSWGRAFRGQKYGTKVRLLIPSHLAYGKNGSTKPNVPSNAILDTYISTSVYKKQYLLDDAKIQTFLTSKSLTAVKDLSRVYYITNTLGTGTDPISLSSNITFKYTGRLLDGTVFDSSTDGTASYLLSQLIPGWQKILTKFKAGGKVRLLIPSDLGYGPTGSYNQNTGTYVVPANAVLDFDVEVISVTN